ncbi:hypothetical protein CsSME_00041517 [Camellia sinensis var. sinensis]
MESMTSLSVVSSAAAADDTTDMEVSCGIMYFHFNVNIVAMGLANLIGGLFIIGPNTDDKDLKLVLVVAASLLCIAILAIGKAYIQKKPNFYAYIKTVLYYISMAVMASGISYAAGELIKRLVEKLGWFDSSVAVTLSLPQVQSVNPALGSY